MSMRVLAGNRGHGGSDSNNAPSGTWAHRGSQGLVLLRLHIRDCDYS